MKLCNIKTMLVFLAANGDSPIKLMSASMTPYPPVIPGIITLSLTAETTKEISNLDLGIQINVNEGGTWVEVPCIDGVGSW